MHFDPHAIRVLIGTVFFMLGLRSAWAQGPIDLQIAIEEANESLFDGEYSETIRIVDKGLDWTSKATNRKLLASVGRDWTIEECMLQVLKAEALLLSGERSVARSQLSRAVAKLEARRTYYHRTFGSADWYWLYSAFVHFTEGDTAQPATDLGISETDLPETVIRLSANSWGHAGKALVSYNRAGDCLERVLALDPTPTQQAVVGLPLVVNRLMLRLLVNKAKVSIHKIGKPSAEDVTDAEAFLMRAEELLRNNAWWTTFVAPNALFPLSYSRFVEVEEEKKRAPGAVNGGVREQELISLKQLWCHAINDYVTVMNSRAESEALKDANDVAANPAKPWARDNAERCFQKAIQLCQEQYRRIRHPLLVATEFSKARWLAIVSDKASWEHKPGKLERRQLVSYARDCLFLVRKITAHSPENLPVWHAFELRCIEYRALLNIQSLHALDPFLNPDQLKQISDRKDALVRELELLAKEKP